MTDLHGAPGAVWAFEAHEHRDLLRGIDQVHALGCGIGAWVTPGLSDELLSVIAWFDHTLAPHIAWEEAWLYPEIDSKTGTAWATRSVRFDHAQIRATVARLRTDQQDLHRDAVEKRLSDLRCHLFSLEALLRAHIEREERFLLPILADDTASVARGDLPPAAG